MGIEKFIPEFAIPEFPNWLLLGSCREAPGHWDAAVEFAGADFPRGLAEAQDRALGVQLHLLQLGFLIRLLSALTHHRLQNQEWSIGVVE